MRTMYDAVNINAIPADAQMVAGYVDGNYQTYPAIVSRWPHAIHVSITVFGRPNTQVADCEAGDLSPSEAAAWAKTELTAGRKPTIYCSASPWPTVQEECRKIGVDPARVSWWIADYDGDPTVPSGAVAKQYKSTNVDVSSVVNHWPGVDPDDPAQTVPQSYGLAPRHAWWIGHGDYNVDDIPVDAKGVWRDGNALAYWDNEGWTDVHQIPPGAKGVHNFAWTAQGWRPA